MRTAIIEGKMIRKANRKVIRPTTKKNSTAAEPSRKSVDRSANLSIGTEAKPTRLFHKWFATIAASISKSAGSPIVFFAALASIVVWAASGPYFDFSAGWQMIVNAGTAISTFLMVFIIQNSQNRDGMALQIKLDEIIRALHSANNEIINLETLSHDELEHMQTKFAKIGSTARRENE